MRRKPVRSVLHSFRHQLSASICTHGGLSIAVYPYASESLSAWKARLFHENPSTRLLGVYTPCVSCCPFTNFFRSSTRSPSVTLSITMLARHTLTLHDKPQYVQLDLTTSTSVGRPLFGIDGSFLSPARETLLNFFGVSVSLR